MICSLPLESDDVINMDCSGTIKLLHILRSVCVCVYIYTSEAIKYKAGNPGTRALFKSQQAVGCAF